MKPSWKFTDKPNTACFTTSFVLAGSAILRVYHDFDGDWQFHGGKEQPSTTDVARIVALSEIIKLDQSLNELADLPYGWGAERKSSRDSWTRFKNNPYPMFAEEGYYLEDAVWLAENRSDLSPPDLEEIEKLEVGAYVKLIFRFAAEESARKDNQCERMWVQIIGRDEEENFIGSIENDPQHYAAEYGDVVYFHARHVADIGDFD